MRPPEGEPNRGAEQLAFFSPPPNAIPLLLELLADSSNSLLDIALSAHTSLEALAAWMTQPDIAQRLDDLHTIAAQRARLVASQYLAAAALALSNILTASTNPAEHAALSTANPRHLALRLRQRESTRRTAATLLRIATYTPRRVRVARLDFGGADVPSASCASGSAFAFGPGGADVSSATPSHTEGAGGAPNVPFSPPPQALAGPPHHQPPLPQGTDTAPPRRGHESSDSRHAGAARQPPSLPDGEIFSIPGHRFLARRAPITPSPPAPNTS